MARWSVPAKTFLLGEYAALKGGPALVLATWPGFVLSCHPSLPSSPSPFPSAIGSNQEGVWGHAMGHYRVTQPTWLRSGFGRSGAQWWGHCLDTLGMAQVWRFGSPATRARCVMRAWSMYQRVAQGGSGADLVAQGLGGATWWGNLPDGQRVATGAWPWSELAYVVLGTGRTLVTHEHVASVVDVPGEGLQLAGQGWQAWQDLDVAGFLATVNAYQAWLVRMGWQAPWTTEAVAALCEQPWCLAAKGCGAMGAESLIVLCALDALGSVQRWSKRWGLRWVAGGQRLASGVTRLV